MQKINKINNDFPKFTILFYSSFLSMFHTGTTGQTTAVTCNAGYSGGGTVTCDTNGQFNETEVFLFGFPIVIGGIIIIFCKLTNRDKE